MGRYLKSSHGGLLARQAQAMGRSLQESKGSSVTSHLLLIWVSPFQALCTTFRSTLWAATRVRVLVGNIPDHLTAGISSIAPVMTQQLVRPTARRQPLSMLLPSMRSASTSLCHDMPISRPSIKVCLGSLLNELAKTDTARKNP